MDDIEKENIVNMVIKETTKAVKDDNDAIFHMSKVGSNGPFFTIKGSHQNLVQGLVTTCLQNKEIHDLLRFVVYESDRVRVKQADEVMECIGKA